MIDLVVNTFGMYGGKVLEKITHNEDPWMEARKGYGDSIPSVSYTHLDVYKRQTVIRKSSIM